MNHRAAFRSSLLSSLLSVACASTPDVAVEAKPGLLMVLPAGPDQATQTASTETTPSLGDVPTAVLPPSAAAIMAQVDPARAIGYVHALAGFGTRHTLSETESTTRGIGAARRYIRDEMQRAATASGRTGSDAMTVRLESFRYAADGQRIDRDVDIVNVVAVLPGRMPEARHRHYYVVGHYDSRVGDIMDAESDAPGANDDASGTAVVMELAAVMSRHEFDASIVFLATAAEEQGLLGARLHAEAAVARGVDIRGVLSNDIVGDPSDPRGGEHRHAIRLFSPERARDAPASELAEIARLSASHDGTSRQLARYVATVAAWENTTVQPMLVFRPDRFLRGGDHTAFTDLGFAGVRFCEAAENYDRQHQAVRNEDGRAYGDVAEHVDAEYLADVVKLNAAALTHLANAPSVPARARIIVAELTNDTQLRWEPSPEPDVVGYEVVRRRTSHPTWEHVHAVGAATDVTLPFSKDNWFFGVRAVDQDGYRSPVAFPVAARE